MAASFVGLRWQEVARFPWSAEWLEAGRTLQGQSRFRRMKVQAGWIDNASDTALHT
jgi:hypothetical protein